MWIKNACVLLWCCLFAPLIYGLLWNPFFEEQNLPCVGVLLKLWHMCYILPHTVFFWFLSFFACFWTKSPYTAMFFFLIFLRWFSRNIPKKKTSSLVCIYFMWLKGWNFGVLDLLKPITWRVIFSLKSVCQWCKKLIRGTAISFSKKKVVKWSLKY